MSRAIWYAAGIAVIFVVGFAAAGLYFGGSRVGPPPTSAPTPTPSPTASPLPTPDGTRLPAGQNSPTNFFPSVGFTLPQGWTLRTDEPFVFDMVRPGAGYFVQGDGAIYFDGIKGYNRPLAGPPDGATVPVEGVGTTAHDLAIWLSERPQLVATVPVPVTVAGIPGYQLDFSLSAAAGGLCGPPCVNLLNSPDNDAYYAFGIEGPWKGRAFLLDAPTGTLMITIEDLDGVGFQEEVAAAEPIIASMSLGPLPSASP